MLKKIGSVAGGLIVLVVVAIVLTLAVLAGYEVFFRITGTRFTETQVGSAGAWASALGATALAVASVWLVRESEKRAKEESATAENRHNEGIKRLEKEALVRKAELEREREFSATESILKESARYGAEVFAFLRTIENSESLTKLLADSEQLSEPDRMAHQLQSLHATESQQQNLLRISNECVTAVRLAIYQLKNRSMREAASRVLNAMLATSACFSTPNKENDWETAEMYAKVVIAAHAEMQRVAIYRFEHADDNVPSPEAPPRPLTKEAAE